MKSTGVLGYRVTIVNHMDAFDEARQHIDNQDTLYVDVEGVHLSRFGSVRVVTIGVENRVYLFDVQRGKPKYLKLVKPFLKQILLDITT